jgi:cytochrome c oxidase assembly protein subunit 15
MNDTKKSYLLRQLSKLTCAATIFLIFVGALVNSTNSGLSVPDWPLSYGMVFPPMVGGVFYEHGHRMVATVVGFLMLCLAILTACYEKRRWVKNLAFLGLGAVIAQGILGGMTVKMFLPMWVSVCHGILAQTFLVITVILAYSFSMERERRIAEVAVIDRNFLRTVIVLITLIYLQLIVGAIMRHSHSGLAIPDFPTIGGEWWPRFDQAMTATINSSRFDMNLEPVSIGQIHIHLMHRVGAVILLLTLLTLNFFAININKSNPLIHKTLFILNALFAIQIGLGIISVLSQKEYHFTSLHVVTGAVVLLWSVLLLLRAAPMKLKV